MHSSPSFLSKAVNNRFSKPEPTACQATSGCLLSLSAVLTGQFTFVKLPRLIDGHPGEPSGQLFGRVTIIPGIKQYAGRNRLVCLITNVNSQNHRVTR